MKSLMSVLSLAAVLGTAACAGNMTRPTDTGNMAFPTPVPQGNIAVSRPATLDTGSMNTPAYSGGALRPANPGFDTGNMALPSRAQGNSRPGSY